MQIDFRIDFGYQYLYSRKHYHPTFIWDGEISVKNGEITDVYRLEYPYIWYGPGQTAREIPLSEPKWKIKTKREFTGIRVVADVAEDACFFLHTASIDIQFTAREITEKGRLDFSVGPKYLGCSVIVTKKDYLWFRRPIHSDEAAYEADELGAQVHNFARMKLAWLLPGEKIRWEYVSKPKDKDFRETLVHIVAMLAPKYTGGVEEQVRGYIPLELYCDGKKLLSFQKYYRHHDKYMQMLEDDWQRVKISEGKHVFELKNLHNEYSLAISRIIMKECGYSHGELSIPEWALLGEQVMGKVFSVTRSEIMIEGVGAVSCEIGWNEFFFCPEKSGVTELSTGKHKASIEIFDCKEEKHPVKVGYDMTTVVHDNSGFMDWLLDYTVRTRLGNYVVFRNFKPEVPDENEWRRYGAYCLSHGIYVSSCSDSSYPYIVEESGEMFSDCGPHEYSGIVYAWDPKPELCSETMKEATEKFQQHYKKKIDELHSFSPSAALGDASGGIRHSFIAGADLVRAETMVGHTMTLLSGVRPAAEALGKGRWGVHIAIQHAHQPYHEYHLGIYFLSLMQPWVMGAEIIYEEDSLFNLFKEERQAWDDALTKGKRDMTRAFYKFAKTHPRNGKSIRKIAYIDGRYAAPFNGFIAGCEQDPHYSVWGALGNADKTWGHGQPEKARHLLDVLMPGASVIPMRQKFDKRRFYFSGTPHGDFDCVPIEASADYLKGYKLLLNLGWNTALSEDIDKLVEFVKAGGILLTGLPQFSEHIRRDFLADMSDLALINGGDLSEVCGIKVIGIDSAYSGAWNAKNREEITEPELSSLPNDNENEDGEAYLAKIELCGAEVVAWDYSSGIPMLVKHKLGDGFVYTFTAWAYPGHEKLQRFSAAWIEQLSKSVRDDIYVEDASGEVFWSVWEEEGKKTVMLLNTDWTVSSNEKNVALTVGKKRYDLAVKERRLTMVHITNDGVSIENYSI